LRRSLAITTELGVRSSIAQRLWGVGVARHAAGGLDEARACWQEAIALLHEDGALTTEGALDLSAQAIPEMPQIFRRGG
jgi:hypothetical protein